MDVVTTELRPLSDTELRALDAYWRAANYLSVASIFRVPAVVA